MDCKFFNIACHDKNTHRDFKLLLLLFVFGWIFLTKYFKDIHHHCVKIVIHAIKLELLLNY
jgi:hypothetical protein